MLKKPFAKWRKKIKNKLAKTKIKLPSLEDALFAFLLVFSLTFSALLFDIGKKIETHNYAQAAPVSKFEKDITAMVSGKPIERMTPYIADKNKDVAAFMLAIAKKESNWGKYHPVKNGKECFNYWGYRGTYNQTDSGYSCFRNPEQAVNVVGNRIEELLAQNINTPEEMVVWKCGRVCETHDPQAVAKWIDDVDLYYDKVNRL